jgi:hypothetical protein
MNPKVLAAITAALLAAGAWFELRSSEARDITLVCDWSEVDGGIIESAHEEVVMVRGDVTPEKFESDKLKCKTAKVGEVYACSPGAPFTRLGEAALDDGCACSDGSAGCEALDDKDKWGKAPKSTPPINLNPGRWRGTCIPKPCIERAELISGVGAVNALNYTVPKACGGPGKKPPSGAVVKASLAKAEAVEVRP